MKPEDLIKAAEDLNIILGLKPPIDSGLPPSELSGKIKKAALWLFVSDEPEQTTIAVLKTFKWKDDDFLNLENPKEQDPLPAFHRFGILKDKFKAKKRKPSPPPTEKDADGVTDVEVIPEEHTGLIDPKDKPGMPSAYSAAIAITCANPHMRTTDLYAAMKKNGYDLQSSTGSIKTAHSICRKVFFQLKENGFIKEGA